MQKNFLNMKPHDLVWGFFVWSEVDSGCYFVYADKLRFVRINHKFRG